MKNERSVGLGMFVAITGAALLFMFGALSFPLAVFSVVLNGALIAIAEAMR